MEIHLNGAAIAVSALVYFFLGYAWYSFLFQKPWMEEMKIPKLSKKEMERRMKGMWKPMLGNYLALLVTAWVVTNVVQFAGGFLHKSGALHGMITSFYLWLGLVATTLLNTVLWEGKSWKLYAINVGYHFCGLILMGAILAAWL